MANIDDWQALFGSDDEDYEHDSETIQLSANSDVDYDKAIQTYEQVPGLTLYRAALDHREQMKLIQHITDNNIFGQGNQAMRFGQLGPELETLSQWFLEQQLLPPSQSSRVPLFDQAIYNLYNKGEGIISHVDLAKFDDGIVIISLLSSCCMTMRPAIEPQTALYQQGYRQAQGQQQEHSDSDIDILLRPGDILILSSDARYLWEHGIAEREIDTVDNETVIRGTRISVTLRKLLPAS